MCGIIWKTLTMDLSCDSHPEIKGHGHHILNLFSHVLVTRGNIEG
jgi:hypothetical protein